MDAPAGPQSHRVIGRKHPLPTIYGLVQGAAGFYSHILSANGARRGDWYFWIVDDSGKRISAIGHVHTDGETGEGKCQQAILDFDTADFRLTGSGLWDVVENGGRVDDSGALVCGEGRSLEVQALYGAQETDGTAFRQAGCASTGS